METEAETQAETEAETQAETQAEAQAETQAEAETGEVSKLPRSTTAVRRACLAYVFTQSLKTPRAAALESTAQGCAAYLQDSFLEASSFTITGSQEGHLPALQVSIPLIHAHQVCSPDSCLISPCSCSHLCKHICSVENGLALTSKMLHLLCEHMAALTSLLLLSPVHTQL